MNATLTHRHGLWAHEHHHRGPHRHLRMPFRSVGLDSHTHSHTGERGHSHGLVDPSIVRSRGGVRAVAWSLAILVVTTALQATVFVATQSVALLADLIHNGGDALTAVPLGAAFVLVSRRGERIAGYVVVAIIFASACVAGIAAIDRLIHPQHLEHLFALALGGVIGYAGNELAARVRLRAGRRLASPALMADGQHARGDGYVSLGVAVSAGLVAAGIRVADPLIALLITALLLRVTAQAWHTIRATHAD